MTHPAIDDFLDTVDGQREWTNDTQQAYDHAIKQCGFADPIVRAMLPYKWDSWVIEGICANTSADKWMSAMAPQYWNAQNGELQMDMEHIDQLLKAGCALEHSLFGQHILGMSVDQDLGRIVSKRLLQTDDRTIIDVLERSSQHTTNVAGYLLRALLSNGWSDQKFVNDTQMDENLEAWAQRIRDMSGGRLLSRDEIVPVQQRMKAQEENFILNEQLSSENTAVLNNTKKKM